MREVSVRNTNSGLLLGGHIRIADTSLTRLFGLLSRSGINAGEGLWIQPSSGVHTFFMRFTIDVVGLDRNMEVIKLWRRLLPFRVTTIQTKMRSVIELPAGQIDVSGTKLGDKLVFE